MSDLKRLVDEDLTSDEFAILQSARLDVPGPSAREKTIQLVAGTAMAGAVVAQSTGGGIAGAKAAKTLGALAKFVSTSTAKWTAIVVVGTSTSIATVAHMRAPEDKPVAVTSHAGQHHRTADPIVRRTQPAASFENKTLSVEVPVEVPAEVPATPPPSVTAIASENTKPRSAPAKRNVRFKTNETITAPSDLSEAQTRARSPSLLSQEIGLIDTARRAVAATDPRAALQALDEHDQTFPRGSLALESVALRVQALVQLGDRAAARSLADRFLKSFPNGAYAKRIKGLVSAP